MPKCVSWTRLYEDFNDRTWSDLLDELMSEDMFN